MAETIKINEPAINDKLKEYISRSLLIDNLKYDQDLVELGIVHSLFAVQLTIFIEKEFGVELTSGEIDFEKIKSIQDIAALIIEKMAPNM